jgi:hypothetical protein
VCVAVCVWERESVCVCGRPVSVQSPSESTPEMPSHQSVGSPETLQEQGFNLKLSGNEVYRTKALLLLITSMLCSRLHCQEV